MPKVAKSATEKAIFAFEKYIWTLAGKCPSITEANRMMIAQYCRFMVLADEVSLSLVQGPGQDEIETLVSNYEKYNKICINLYKILQFDKIKDDLADFGNPYTKMLMEAEQDGDI